MQKQCKNHLQWLFVFFVADCRWICHTKCGSTGLSISATCTKRYRRMPATTSTRLNVSEMKTLSSPCRLRNISIKVSSSSSSSQIWSLKLDLDIKYIYMILYIYITTILNVDKQFILLFQKMFFSHSAASEQHPVADSRWIPCRPNVSPGCPTLANGQTQAFGGSSGCKIAKFPSDDVRIYIYIL